jgi:hypothetical protein
MPLSDQRSPMPLLQAIPAITDLKNTPRSRARTAAPPFSVYMRWCVNGIRSEPKDFACTGNGAIFPARDVMYSGAHVSVRYHLPETGRSDR